MEARPTFFDTDPNWLDELRAWARGRPEVTALWLFGSRASGVRTVKEDPPEVPDLDIAFEVEGDTDDERYQAHWVGPRAKPSLSAALGVSLDLQWLDATQTPTVAAYVAATGWRFYSRD